MTEERRLAAIVFCDVCGFSRIMGEDETRAIAVVGMATGCIESAASIYGGRIIKKLGDGALCEFPSAVNAVRCAIEVQKAVANHNAASEPAQHFQMRIGIHVGDVVVNNGDILGDGVNVASRIEPLAEPGGICISRDVFDLVKNKVSIETVNLGPHDLKNISRQIDIYKVLIDAVTGGAPSGQAKTLMQLRSRARRIPSWAAGILIGALVVVGASAVLKGLGAHQARSQFEAATRDARALAEAGKFPQAIERLKAYPAKFRKTAWQAKVDEDVAAIETRAAREAITARQKLFFKAVTEDDKNTALRLLDPRSLDEGDPGAMWMKMRMASGLLKAASAGADSFRIEAIDIAADRQSARTWLKVFLKTQAHPEGTWEDVAPSEWRFVNGEWCLIPQARKPPLPMKEREGRRFQPPQPKP